ncbi:MULTISPECIES: glycerophosphodiester phosphodiesterase [unclassified Oceanispirochaeta]|uniref:glycerophosphodiester phosphodiesterase n=1 Tax=unclassified Oceanispirochaeta TaxID=2635722 RepID=UPI000E0958F2|nr:MULTISPECIES: glycerophosphodiester phosphodiesterase [unclassified Oceanispirochaeta]MBF9015279.1 glycerophosphodiester phosphodiesterase [Oceanispirochaeta sp. M2]NPD71737.1 glycerophosphodiester phosphodiesterase [Oceanispirochaeta sp. M1]RDG32929.1 glycerophosphodiester phosphodiesterase [Oceanispirochaeta sp. M1]
MTDFFSPQPRALAHRGNSQDFPENTEASFRSAYEMGVDVIETDVRLMKDGDVLIFHDPDLSRCTGDRRLISTLSLEDLKDIDMGFLFSKDQGRTFPHRDRGIRPLLLKDALRLFPETRFNIDMKDPGRELAEKTAGVIKAAGAEKRVCIGSFHHSSIRAFREELPGTATSLCQREMIKVLLLYRSGWVPASVKSGQVRAVQIPEKAGPYRLIRPSFLSWCRKNKLAVQVWTINEEEKMRSLFSEGVDGIFSDIPQMLVKVCKDYSILAPPRQMSSS